MKTTRLMYKPPIFEYDKFLYEWNNIHFSEHQDFILLINTLYEALNKNTRLLPPQAFGLLSYEDKMINLVEFFKENYLQHLIIWSSLSEIADELLEVVLPKLYVSAYPHLSFEDFLWTEFLIHFLTYRAIDCMFMKLEG